MRRNRDKLVVKHPKLMRQRKASTLPRAIKGKNEVVEYADTETRGCKIVTMKRCEQNPLCPYESWEPTCYYKHRDNNMWSCPLTESRWQIDTCLMLLEMAPKHKLSWIDARVLLTLWNVRASEKQSEEEMCTERSGACNCETRGGAWDCETCTRTGACPPRERMQVDCDPPTL